MFDFNDSSLGLGRRGRKRRKGRKARRGACAVKTVRFKTKYGVRQFRARSGSGCGPRRKPSTAHLAPYKRRMRAAAKSCKGLKKRQFESCIASAMHHSGGFGRRRRRR
jgi:hypothetical protein